MAFGIGVCSQPYLKNHNIPQKEKDRILRPKNLQQTNTEEIIRPPYKAMSVCFIILFICAFLGFSMWNASEERQLFKNNVSKGDSFLQSGDYDNAIESYKDAYNAYNAISSGSYKSDALDKMDFIVDQLIKEGETNNKSLLQAYKIIQSELQLNLDNADKERIEKKLTDLDVIITERVNNGRNTLITNLSANNGRLDDNSKVLLSELLELAPNDYWLNFIKKKNNEQNH